ncbi:MAG: hypothetical protein GX567_14235 [Clostridia bacterium]|nr:hypothetical protein [Clostridia bacterium]
MKREKKQGDDMNKGRSNYKMMKKWLALLVAAAIVLPGIFFSTVEVEAANQDWSTYVTAQVTYSDDEVTGVELTDDLEVKLTGSFAIHYKVSIGDLNINTNDTVSDGTYGGSHKIGRLDERLDPQGLANPIQVTANGGAIVLGTITYDPETRDILFTFDPNLAIEHPNELLGDIEFDYTTGLDASKVGDAQEVTIDFSGGNGQPSKTVVIKDNKPVIPTLSKTAGAYDSASNTIEWTVTLVSHGIDYSGKTFHFQDTFSNGLFYLDPSLSISGNGIPGTPSIPEVTTSSDANNVQSISFDYTLTSDFTQKDKTIVFKYKTKVADSVLAGIAENGGTFSKAVSNQINVTNTTDSTPIGSANATTTVSKTIDNWLEKSHDNLVIDSSGNTATLEWTLKIYLNGYYGSMEELHLHDTMDYPLQYVGAQNGKVDISFSVNSDTCDHSISELCSVGTQGSKAIINGDTGIDLKALIDAANVSNPTYITLRYTTRISDWAAYQEGNHAEPKNNAWLTWNWKDYYGPGKSAELTGPVLTKESGMGSSVISKEGVYDPSTREIKWTVCFNQNKLNLGDNITVEDVIGAGQEYIVDSASITETDPAGTITLVRQPTTPVAAGETAVFGFSSIGATKVTMTFRTKLIDSETDFFAKNASKDYLNTAILKAGGVEYDRATATVHANSTMIAKEAGTYDHQTHQIPWTVTVNQNLMALTDVVVTDLLSAGTTLLEGTGELTYELYQSPNVRKETFNIGTTISTTEPYYTYKAPTNTAKGELKIYLPDIEKDYYGKIKYQTVVDVNSPYFANKFGGQNTTVVVDNHASLGNQYTVSNGPAASAHVDLVTRALEKAVEIKNRDTLKYTVNINASQTELPANTALKDVLSAKCMSFNMGTVTLSTATVAPDGTLTEGEALVKGTDYAVSITTNASNCEEMIIRLLRKRATALILKYEVIVDTDDPEVTSYSNGIQLGTIPGAATDRKDVSREDMRRASASGSLRESTKI